MAWLLLALAGLCEVGWAVGLKASEGFSRPIPSLVTAVFLAASMGRLALAMRSLPLGVAYTVWTGIGAVGAFVVGILFLGEPVTALRLIAASLIVGGLVLMKMSST